MKLSRQLILLLAILSFSACQKEVGPDTDTPTGYESLQSKSEKRGVAFNFSQLPDIDIPNLGPACSWSYNWGVNLSTEASALFAQYGMDYCPMAWNANWNEDTFRAFKKAHPECKYLLAYNEPNLTDQANMVPATAAEDWGRLVAIARELDLKLIAPAMNYGTLEGYHDPWKWYDEFFAIEGVSWDDVDGIALHCYMGSAGGVKQFLDGFKKYGKPLWLTEFCNWSSNNVSADAQMKYMVETINMLEADPDVFRYAWFIPRGHGESQCHNSLLGSKSPFALTDLGKVFVNMSTQDKSLWYKAGTVIPAEHYNSCTGAIHLAPTDDSVGVLSLTDLKKDTAVDYQIEIPEDATYTLTLRFNTYFETALRVSLDGSSLGLADLPNTDYKWDIFKVDLPLSKGRHTLSLSGTTAFPVSLNYLSINKL